MTEYQVGTSSAAAADNAVDALVARYAVIGVERRRQRRRALVGRAAGAAGAVGLGLAVWLADVNFAALAPGLDELRALRTRLGTELDAFSASRTELEMQQARLERRSDELAERMTDFERMVASLEAERSEIRMQNVRVDAALARIETERQTLLAALSSLPARAAENPETRVVSAEPDTSTPKSTELDMEALVRQSRIAGDLGELERRREALQSRRAELEARRLELEAMLAEAGRGGGEDVTVAADEPAEREDFIVASTVTPETLGNMRGGIMLGDGMNVSIGLTRSASVNGVEQATSTFHLDGLSRGLGPVPVQSFEPLVIQTGPGNSIDSAFLGGATGFGTIVQNSLDDQIIDTRTIYDISITDVAKTLDSVAAGQALRDSLYFQQ